MNCTMEVLLNKMKKTYCILSFISLVLLVGCDSNVESNNQRMDFTPIELMELKGLWEVRTTVDIQDGVILNTNVVDRNAEWVYISDIVNDGLTFGTYQYSETLNCLEMRSIELTLDYASRYYRNSDDSFFANITVVPPNRVMAITKERELVLARERIDLAVDMLVVCE